MGVVSRVVVSCNLAAIVCRNQSHVWPALHVLSCMLRYTLGSFYVSDACPGKLPMSGLAVPSLQPTAALLISPRSINHKSEFPTHLEANKNKGVTVAWSPNGGLKRAWGPHYLIIVGLPYCLNDFLDSSHAFIVQVAAGLVHRKLG